MLSKILLPPLEKEGIVEAGMCHSLVHLVHFVDVWFRLWTFGSACGRLVKISRRVSEGEEEYRGFVYIYLRYKDDCNYIILKIFLENPWFIY